MTERIRRDPSTKQWSDKRFSAGVCRRGHYVETMIELRHEPPEHCGECGAKVYAACPECGARILGGYVGAAGHLEPDEFCRCGAPFPWASEQSTVLHLENQLLDQPDLSEADRREIAEQLQALTDKDAKADRRARAGAAIKRIAPQAWMTAQPLVRQIVRTEVLQHIH